MVRLAKLSFSLEYASNYDHELPVIVIKKKTLKVALPENDLSHMKSQVHLSRIVYIPTDVSSL